MTPWLRRLPIRLLTNGVVIIAALVIVGLFPLWLVLAVVADALTDWGRHRQLRVLLMFTVLVLNEIFGLICMFALWVATGFGVFMHSERSYLAHGRLHGRWTRNIAAATQRLLAAPITITGLDQLDPAPCILMQRHASLLDAVMPSVMLTSGDPHAPRHVMMRELRFDPCIDALGHRTPNHFVDRDAGGPKELAAITKVGKTLGPTGSGVIFPEGNFRTEKRYERAVESIGKRNPELAERAKRLRHVMPPRPGGIGALLKASPGTDVVVVAHVGFEGFATIKDIATRAPIGRPVEFKLKRVPRSEIPTEDPAFTNWLFDQYEWIDDFVGAGLDPGTPLDPKTQAAPVLDVSERAPVDLTAESAESAASARANAESAVGDARDGRVSAE